MTSAAVHSLPGPGTTFRDQVAAEVRAHLARRSISGRNLAKLIDRDQTWVSRRLKGTIPMTTDDLDLIAGGLGMTAIELLLTIPNPGTVRPIPATDPETCPFDPDISGRSDALGQVIALTPRIRPAQPSNGSPGIAPGRESATFTPTGGDRVEHHACAA